MIVILFNINIFYRKLNKHRQELISFIKNKIFQPHRDPNKKYTKNLPEKYLTPQQKLWNWQTRNSSTSGRKSIEQETSFHFRSSHHRMRMKHEEIRIEANLKIPHWISFFSRLFNSGSGNEISLNRTELERHNIICQESLKWDFGKKEWFKIEIPSSKRGRRRELRKMRVREDKS